MSIEKATREKWADDELQLINKRIAQNALELADAIWNDGESSLEAILSLLVSQCASRRTILVQRRRREQNACDRFAGGGRQCIGLKNGERKCNAPGSNWPKKLDAAKI